MPRLFLALLLTCALPMAASAQLEPTWEAHGGAALWKSYGALEYHCTFTMGPLVLKDRQLFDLQTRDGLITSDDQKYVIGASDGQVWVAPDKAALPLPARFYMWTPFYFFGLPLILSDPGVNLKPEGQAEYEGKTYDLVRATFGQGIGDAPEDFYLCYIDPASKELRLAVYIVTYAPLRKAANVDEIPTSAAVYEEWQTVGGLKLPKRVDLYQWANGKPDGAAKGSLVFGQVALSKERPESSRFTKPNAAEVDNSHMPPEPGN